jgi:integrase
MSADGSAAITRVSASAALAVVSLADVLRRLEDHAEIDPRRRRELCSALHTVCRVLGKEPASLPADLRHLRVLLAPITPAVAGVCVGRWANVRSLALKALKHAEIRAMPGRYRERHAPEWEVLRARLPDRHFQSGLSRVMSYCTARAIGPASVTADTFVAFGAELEAHSLARDPGGLYRDTCKLWNRAAASIDGWPQLQIEVPVRRVDIALPLDAFPKSFRKDVEGFLTQGAEPDVFSESYCRPVHPLTVRNRRQKILMAATALAKNGFPMAQITGLAVLVELEQAKPALRFLYDRAGGKTTGHIYQIATLLKTISRHHAHNSEEAIEPLRKLCKALKPKSAGLTEKNKRFLRQFTDLKKLVALLTLPERVIRQAERGNGNRRRDAVRIELAVAIAVELVIPIRVENLAGLCLDRHLQFVGNRAYLAIPAEETKNDNAIEAELPPYLTRQLRIYIETYRPMLFGSPTPWLFPGENGERRGTGGFGMQIGAFVAREAGVMMTTHQFRHLAAKLYLDQNPDGVETVRRLLGHKSIETTMRFYRELESVLATKRYGEFLQQLLTDAQTAIPPKRRRRRPGEGEG